MRVLVVGDLHGNLSFARYVAGVARSQGCDRVVQVGDFGYAGHTRDGVTFLDQVSQVIVDSGTPWTFLDGNHDNRAFLVGQHLRRDSDGFLVVREGLTYADRAHRWSWGGVRFMAFGGAASTDRGVSQAMEAHLHAEAVEVEDRRQAAGLAARPVPDFYEWFWFAGEQATDDDLAAALAGPPVDVLMCHDKPRLASMGRPESPSGWLTAQQDKIQQIVDRFCPELVVHGHHHLRYESMVGRTRVVGLSADDRSPGRQWSAEGSWLVLPLDPWPPREGPRS